MSTNIKEPIETMQEQSDEIERYALYRFEHSLSKGIKARIKSCGCQWSSLHQGWLCPINQTQQIEKYIEESSLAYTIRQVPLPKGMISSDPLISGKQVRLDILEDQYYQEEKDLLVDVVSNDPSLHPIDLAEPPAKDGKTAIQFQIEYDLHLRVVSNRNKKEEIDRLKKELSILKEDPPTKILDRDAPLIIADMLIKNQFLYGEQRTLQYCSDSFWHWNGLKYEELPDGAIRQIIYAYLRDAKSLVSTGGLESFNPSKYKVDQIIDALKGICYQKHHPSSGAVWLDQRTLPNPKFLIPFQNGLLNITDWLLNSKSELIPHSPLLLNANVLPFAFDPQAEEPEAWLQFLNSLWPNDIESQQLLQEWIGYLLIQDTSLHKILLMVGPTRSGKGTIGRILVELLGHSNVVGPTLSSLSGEFGLQPLQNKILGLISDARLNGKGNNNIIIERLLSISGEDPLTINRKFLPALTVQLPTRIMMMSNELPDMKDASGALANRYLVLTMKRSWLGKEDPTLFSRLQDELPGILLWALQGLERLKQRKHFIQPTNSLQTIEELNATTSPIKAFVKERCSLKPEGVVAVPKLFQEWCNWCMSSGETKIGLIQSFGKNFRAAFPEIESTRPQEGYERERHYIGISLKEVYTASADVRGH